MRLAFIAAAVAILALAALSTPLAAVFSEGRPAAADGPQAAPTYISEAGPASTRAPRPGADLPTSGTGTESGGYWPAIAGISLALLGVALIHAARTTNSTA
ncbi:MAG: hypothetical protein WEB04_08165 [Dehalococcoidia bacterium]